MWSIEFASQLEDDGRRRLYVYFIERCVPVPNQLLMMIVDRQLQNQMFNDYKSADQFRTLCFDDRVRIFQTQIIIKGLTDCSDCLCNRYVMHVRRERERRDSVNKTRSSETWDWTEIWGSSLLRNSWLSWWGINLLPINNIVVPEGGREKERSHFLLLLLIHGFLLLLLCSLSSLVHT